MSKVTEANTTSANPQESRFVSTITRTRPEFIQSLKQWDADAWDRFQKVYVPTIEKMCRWAIDGVKQDQIDDIQQNVLAKLVQYIGNFQLNEEQPGSFRKYLRMITRTEISNYYAQDQRLPPDLRRLRRLFGDEFFEKFDAEATAIAVSNVRTSSKITQESWDAFHEYLACHDLTYDTVAEKLGKTPTAVRKRVSRVVDRIKKELGD